MENKIESLLNNTFENIKKIIDGGNVVGEPIISEDSTYIIPFSKVSFGFLAGGGEYGAGSAPKGGKKAERAVQPEAQDEFPYAGGSGGGVIIDPIGFLVIKGGERQLIKIDKNTEDSKWTDLVKNAVSLVKNKQ